MNYSLGKPVGLVQCCFFWRGVFRIECNNGFIDPNYDHFVMIIIIIKQYIYIYNISHFVNTGSAQLEDTTKIVAPIVVIGALIVGLLLALLVCKRRTLRKYNRAIKTVMVVKGNRPSLLAPTCPYLQAMQQPLNACPYRVVL